MVQFYPITKNVFVYEDSVQCGIIKDKNNIYVIDCGDANFLELFKLLNINNVTKAFFTHYHVDNISGIKKINNENISTYVPELEKEMFNNIKKFLKSDESQYKRYNQRPDLNVLRYNAKVNNTVNDNDEFLLDTVKIKAIHTPGHTDGSMSYIISGKNKKTVAFVGDLIFDYGKILNLYSLQKKHSNLWTDYHGYLGAMEEILTSLDKIIANNVDIIIPSHGKIIYNPKKAINELKNNLKKCYENYIEISSANFWFNQENYLKKNFLINEDLISLPSFILEPCEPMKMIISEDKSAFIIDCGTLEAFNSINNLYENGIIKSIEGVWVSHYHDDHIEYINALVEKYRCKVYCYIGFFDILKNPSHYNLPCLYKEKINVDYIIKNFEDIVFKEFTLTTYYFPGQSIYHAALLVKKQNYNESILFAGDAFTPTGIDDYCSYNINPLQINDGYFYCLDLINKIKPNIIVNQHQKGGFKFSDKSLSLIKDNLIKRINILENLLPNDNVNYGLNQNWLKMYPYCQNIYENKNFNIKISIENLTSNYDFYKLELRLPEEFKKKNYEFELKVAPNDTRHVNFSFSLNNPVENDLYLVGLAVWKNEKFLGEVAHVKLIKD